MCQMIKRNLDFPKWLQEQLDSREWRPTDLARKSNLSDAAVSRVLKSERQADIDTLMSFAFAFNMSPMAIIRKAFDLPKAENEDDVNWDDWKHLINQLTPQEEQNIKRMTEVTIESRQKSEQATRAKNFKPGKIKK